MLDFNFGNELIKLFVSLFDTIRLISYTLIIIIRVIFDVYLYIFIYIFASFELVWMIANFMSA